MQRNMLLELKLCKFNDVVTISYDIINLPKTLYRVYNKYGVHAYALAKMPHPIICMLMAEPKPSELKR